MRKWKYLSWNGNENDKVSKVRVLCTVKEKNKGNDFNKIELTSLKLSIIVTIIGIFVTRSWLCREDWPPRGRQDPKDSQDDQQKQS